MELTAEKYRIIETLSETSPVRVLKAQDNDSGEYCLIKEMNLSLLENPVEFVLFQNIRLKRFKGFDSVPVFRITEFGETRNRYTVVQEFVQGPTLLDAIDEGMSLVSALKTIRQVADILVLLEDEDLFCGFLNPKNIILSGEDLVFDYSFPFLEDYFTENGQWPFLRYYAPEQFGIIKKPVSIRSDLYTLGILLYEMIYSYPPFRSESYPDLMHLHTAGQPLYPDEIDLPGAVKEVISKLLEKDSSRRYSNVKALINDLDFLLENINHLDSIAFVPGIRLEDFRVSSEIEFCGRKEELRAFSDFLTRVMDGPNGIFCVFGPEGRGKSRFIRECAFQNKDQDSLQLLVTLSPQDNHRPFGALISVLDQYLKQLVLRPAHERRHWINQFKEISGNLASWLFPSLPILKKIFPGELPETEMAGEGNAARLRYLMHSVFATLSTSLPYLLIILDNAEYADPETLVFLKEFTMLNTEDRILILCSIRTNDDSPSFLPVDNNNLFLQPMGNLEKEDMRTFLHHILPSTSNESSTLIEALLKKTGGNPFHLIRFLQQCISEGYISFDKNLHVDIRSIENMNFSDNVIEEIVRTLDFLPEEVLSVLEIIAVWNENFSYGGFVSCFPEISEVELQSAVDAAVKYRILVLEDRYLFSHQQVCLALYNRIPAEEVAVYHQRIAEYLDSVPELDINYSAVRHWRLANDPERHLARLLDVIPKAQSRDNHRLALAMIDELMKYHPQVRETPLQARILEWIGDSCTYVGEYSKAIKAYGQINDPSATHKDRFRIFQKSSYPFIANGQYDDALACLNGALQTLNESVPDSGPILGLKILIQLVFQNFISFHPYLFYRKKTPEKGGLNYEKLKLYHKMSLVCLWAMKREMTIFSHFRALNLTSVTGFSEQAIETWVTHVAVLVSIDGPTGILRLLNKRSLRFLRKSKAALAHLRSKTPAEALFLVVYAAIGCITKPIAEDPLALSEEALSILKRQGTIRYLLEISSCRAQILEIHGHFNELDSLARDILYQGAVFENPQLIHVGHLYEGIFLFYSGRIKQSRELLEESYRYFESHHDSVNQQYTALFLYKIYYRLGERSRAEEYGDAVFSKIKSEKQIHPIVISRIYLFYLEENILYYRFEKREPLPPEVMKKITFCYKQCQKLAALFCYYKDITPRFELLYRYAKGGSYPGTSYYDKILNRMPRNPDSYSYALTCFYAALCHIQFHDFLSARKNLEKAYFGFESCGADWDLKRVSGYLQQSRFQDETSFLIDGVVSDGDLPSRRKIFRELGTIIDIGKKIGSLHDLDELLPEILRQAVQLVGAEQGLLYLNEGGRLVLKSSVTVGGSSTVPVCKSVLGRVNAEGNPVLVFNAEDDPEWQNDPDVVGYHLKSIMCTPLTGKDGIIGILYLSNHHVGHLFSGHELDLLNVLASEAAIAVENTLLLKKTKSLQARLSSIIHSMPTGIVAVDLEGHILEVNKAAFSLLDHDGTEYYGRSFDVFFPQLSRFRGDFQKVIQQKRHLERTDEVFYNRIFQVQLFPLQEDEVMGGVLKLTDVTDSKKTQEHLVQVQKMEAVGTLVGGIAHDFNNTLSGIIATARYLNQFVLPKDEDIDRNEMADFLSTIETSVLHATDLVSQLLTISMNKDVEPIIIDFVTSLRHVLKLAKMSFDKSIVFEIDIPGSPVPVLADPVQIEQIILNLLINAAHSMTVMRKSGDRWGGLLSVGLQRKHLEEKAALSALNLPAGDYWRLSVEDTGVGMDGHIREKIFEPFFTTKKTGEGTGLGLAMVYSIVRKMNGFVDVYSEPGEGSVFHVYLPFQEEVRFALPQDSRFDTIKGHGTVLIADDEGMLRIAISKSLEAAGFTVLQAEDGVQAENLFKDHRSDIVLVILDLVMPNRTGRETYYLLRELAPGIPFILTSGFKKDQRVDELIQAGVTDFIEKPYSQKELFSSIGRIFPEMKA